MIETSKLKSCFWELTRRCQMNCLHCRADSNRDDQNELDISENLKIADQLISAGTSFVTLTGGEPTLYPGWEQIAKRLSDGGIKVRLFTNGIGFDRDILQKAGEAGVSRFSISLDGPKSIHDQLRPPMEKSFESSYDQAIHAIESMVRSNHHCRIVTQVNAVNIGYLDEIYDILSGLGVKFWQVHLCQMTGRARDFRDELVFDPENLEAVIQTLLRVAKDGKITAPLHCTLGYMTWEEPVLRGRGLKGKIIWQGCAAGKNTLAITPNGSVKGCTILQDEFVTDSLQKTPLHEIWANDKNFQYTRNWTDQSLGGGCLHCSFSGICRSGCPAVAYSYTGSVGTNPYCLKIIRDE